MPVIIVADMSGVVLGTVVGCLVKKRISVSLRESMDLALAAISCAIGIQLVGKSVHMAAAVLALLLGGILGHLLKIDQQLSALSKRLPGASDGEAAQTLLVAFTLYCLSTTGIIGALSLGFEGDSSVLATKAIMDFIASVFFAASSGGVLAVICLPLGLILWLFYQLSGILMPHLTVDMIGDFSACGGLIQLLNAMRIAKLKNPPVADYMPALLLIFFISAAWSRWMQA